ncbi:Thiamine transporter 1 [Armadillidium nasatum]|uniref:Thiamine transporter 1 n=1 Tax=Armadillidium nasatum TaxID=96803 RepID=A0A5N5THW2_9CRUS|nr:Thiamine transporter 1 [Armadillidium nasatum]
MKSWLKISLVLCSYGFFKELRPSEPYLTEYLLGPQKNLTANEINYEIYPVWTYAYLSLLVVVFLVTDFLRYKPVIIFEGFGYVATWCLLLWAPGVKSMQFMEFCYGIATSTEVAYYTYIYAQVEDKYYQRVTSYTRAAILSGKFISALLSQLLTSFGIMNYYNLNYFSLASVSIALCIAFMLPPARRSIYFHREEAKSVASSKSQIEKRTIDIFSVEQEVHNDQEQRNQTRVRKWKISDIKQAFYLLWLDFRDAYTNIYLLKWSIWWAFATCINFQVGNYIQPLWEDISSFKTTDDLYNGSVEAATTLFGALASLTVGYLFFNWKLIGELTLSLISSIDGLLLYFMGKTSHLWVGYVNYVLFRVSYQLPSCKRTSSRFVRSGVWYQHVCGTLYSKYFNGDCGGSLNII